MDRFKYEFDTPTQHYKKIVIWADSEEEVKALGKILEGYKVIPEYNMTDDNEVLVLSKVSQCQTKPNA